MRKVILQFLLLATSALITVSCNNPGISTQGGSPVAVTVLADAQPMSTYWLKITGPDMQTIGPTKYSGGQTIELYVPEGANRLFYLERYDSVGRLTDTGSFLRDIVAGMNTITRDSVTIKLKSVGSILTCTDADGNVYHAVQIGNQVWTVENFRATKYNDGTPIPNITDDAEWLSLITPGYCFFDNSIVESRQRKWGALYNYYTINTGKLAPPGWHVPTKADWTTLESYLIENGYNWDGSTSDNKIAKSLSSETDWTTSWTEGQTGNDTLSNNSSGFSALPGGCRNPDGSFSLQNSCGGWWCDGGAQTSERLGLENQSDSLGSLSNDKKFGWSVRLVRN